MMGALFRAVVLQSELNCYTSQGDRLACVLNDLTAATGGEGLFGLIVGGTILVTLYLAGNGDFAAPSVILILFGAVLFPMLPASFAAVAGTIVLVGVAASVIAVAQRYVLNPGVR